MRVKFRTEARFIPHGSGCGAEVEVLPMIPTKPLAVKVATGAQIAARKNPAINNTVQVKHTEGSGSTILFEGLHGNCDKRNDAAHQIGVTALATRLTRESMAQNGLVMRLI